MLGVRQAVTFSDHLKQTRAHILAEHRIQHAQRKTFLVGPTHHERPLMIGQQLLEDHDFPETFEIPNPHHVHRFVQHHLLARYKLFKIDVGTGADPHLSTADRDVSNALGELFEKDPIAARWLS